MSTHICKCQLCRDVIVEVVQGVLVEDMDLDAGDSSVDTEETVEYSDDEEEKSLADSQDSLNKSN